MSFKDLTARAAAALTPKPAATAKAPVAETAPKTDGTDATPKPKAS